MTSNWESRQQRFAQLTDEVFDVMVIGGGINGAVTAAALAARGVRVALVDRGDFASETSMQSSNLAWGGIKYMESFEFALVRKLCAARNRLMLAYPTAVRETRFLTTVPRKFRLPRWVLYVGAWLYWLMGGFFTQTPRLLSRSALANEQPLLNVDNSVGGFEYSDAHLVDGDARFVFGFIRSAVEHGAVVVNYASADGSRYAGEMWLTEVTDQRQPNLAPIQVRSRVLVNAGGPFADDYNQRSGVSTTYRHVLSKGVHLIVPRLTERDRVLAFFASDGRLFFAIPMGTRSCIGTTDTRMDRMPAHTTDEDRAFILENINAWLRLDNPLTSADIIAERCGVRPLVVARSTDDPTGAVDWTQLSRKHVVEVDASQRQITIFGGKLTDCLNVGRELVHEVAALGVRGRHLQAEASHDAWYGEGSASERTEFLARAAELGLQASTSERLWRCHSGRAAAMLDLVRQHADLAALLYPAADVIRAEAVYAGRHEAVETLQDFLRRRTHLAQLLEPAVLNNTEALGLVAQLLFGDHAQARLDEYGLRV